MKPARIALGFALAVFVAALAARADVPSITHPVTDLANVLAPSETEVIASHIAVHRASSGVQIALLLVPTTGGQPIEDYSIAVAERWRGGAAGRDNGVLVTFATLDRRSRIELGTGLEAQITDAQARTLLDGVRPQLRAGAYGAAALTVVDGVIARTLSQGETMPAIAPTLAPTTPIEQPMPTAYPPPDYGPRDSDDDGFFVLFGFVIVLFVIVGIVFVVLALRRPAGNGWGISSGGTTIVTGPYWGGSTYGSSYDSYSSYGSSSTFGSDSGPSYDSGSSSYGSGSSSNDSGGSGGGGDFGGGGASSGW